MTIQVGINGFGRIGRSVFRIISDRDNIEVVAINDLFENEQLAYLLKFDSVMGVFPKKVTAEADAMTVNSERVKMTAERDPAKIPWKDLGVSVVVESTGVFRNREPLEKHLSAGAEKWIFLPRYLSVSALPLAGNLLHRISSQHQLKYHQLRLCQYSTGRTRAAGLSADALPGTTSEPRTT